MAAFYLRLQLRNDPLRRLDPGRQLLGASRIRRSQCLFSPLSSATLPHLVIVRSLPRLHKALLLLPKLPAAGVAFGLEQEPTQADPRDLRIGQAHHRSARCETV